MITELSIFDNIKKYLDMKYGWIIKAWKSKIRVTQEGDIYVRGSEMFKGREKEWKSFLKDSVKDIKIEADAEH